jgi:broad specificity phosphatase PhoE
MDKLVLVKHSQPEVHPGVPAAQWRLSAVGRARCGTLADRLASFQPFRLFSSREPKAEETAAILARRLGVGWTTVEGLHEHERERVGLLPQADFEKAVEGLLERPGERVFGEETGAAARGRFGRAVDGLLTGRGAGNVVVVSHGTVISLLVAERAAVDPRGLWRGLGLPSYVVLSLPEWRLEEVVRLDAAEQ